MWQRMVDVKKQSQQMTQAAIFNPTEASWVDMRLRAADSVAHQAHVCRAASCFLRKSKAQRPPLRLPRYPSLRFQPPPFLDAMSMMQLARPHGAAKE